MSIYGNNLWSLNDSMHINIATVFWEQREAARSIGVSMKLIQVASNLVWKDCANMVLEMFSGRNMASGRSLTIFVIA